MVYNSNSDILRKGRTMKRIVTLIVVMMLVLAMGTSATFADSTLISTSSGTDSADTAVIDAADIELTKAEERSYSNVAEKIAEEIGDDTDSADVEAAIKDITSNENMDGYEELVDQIAGTISEDVDEQTPRVVMTDDFIDKYEHTYNVSDDVEVTVNPLYIEVTEVNEEVEDAGIVEEPADDNLVADVASLFFDEVYAASSAKSKKYSESKAYYSWAGLKIFTIGMDCNFYYNGKKAWYKSGFDGWYTRGALSIWQVSNWKERREQSGSSYVAWCAGNFHMGLEVKGVGIILDDKYIKHTATCNKNGSVSLSRTGFTLQK